MPRIIRTRESRSDFDNIWAYIAARNLDAADGVVRKLESTLNLLASAPQMGRKVEELGLNLRSFPVGSYLIFYRPVDDGIQLIRIIHGAREITPEYFPEE